MYLGKELIVEEKAFPMAGVFPLRFVLDGSPQGHGYTILEVDTPNPYFPLGRSFTVTSFITPISRIGRRDTYTLAFNVRRGHGIHGAKGWSVL